MSRSSVEIAPKSAETLRLGAHFYSFADDQLRTAGGEVVPLRSQSREVLAALAARAGQIVGKSELNDLIWPDIAVTEDSLVQCIADIRRAIGDDAHRIVQTFPKKGYRLNPGAGAPAANGAPQGLLHRLPLRAVLIAVAALVVAALGLYLTRPAGGPAASDMPRIAVLPFSDLSTGEDAGYLSDAIAEGIIAALARSKTHAVIASNSSFQYRDTPTDVRRIGRDLGVDYVLEGSQQKIGDRLKVTAQLIDAGDGAHLWAQTYDRTIADLFVVQEAIIGALAFQVGEEIERPPPDSDPGRVSALHYYLAGVDALQKDFSAETNRFYRQMATKAVEADPDSQFGYIGLAWTYRNDAVFGWAEDQYDRAEALRRAAEYADRAMALAPDDSTAHGARARIHADAGEPESAVARFDIAIALNPSDSALLVGSTTPLLYVGRTDEAIARIERAKGIDPLYPDRFDWQMGWALWEKRDCAGALRAMQRMAKIPPAAHQMLAAIHACLGDRNAAQQALAVYRTESPARTLREERETWAAIWTAPGSLDRWIEDMRFAGMRE
jgi:TolB-like protein/DNA-binding winged helix-turn-helix (wHTH) protein/Tfp pilus assembly protein PilF